MADATSRVRFLNTDGTAEYGTLDSAGATSLRILKVTIPTADILTSNVTPITVIANPGANKLVQVYRVVYQFNYQTTPYATNTVANLAFLTDASAFGTIDLDKTDSNFYGTSAQITTFGAANTGIKFFTTTGNPTAGDSDLNLWISYSIIDVS